MRPALEVADVFRRDGEAFRRDRGAHLGRVERRLMSAIEACRTATLGGHVEQCGDCGLTRPAYNSCRNRHCPKCQGLARAEWLAPRHPGAEIGAVAVLHTWGQALQHHPHLHCIVPGGGLSPDQTQWVACRPGFFLPVRVLSRRFRTLFLERLRAAFAAGELRFSGALTDLAEPARFAACLGALRGAEWVVYSKRPFAGPEQVLAYLGRYTHRVAIANSRLTRLAGGEVSFSWKDYRHHGKTKVMTLAAGEFMRRFLLHTVPDGFHRIRHLGFLANGHRTAKLARCRALLAAPTPEPAPAESYCERHLRLTGHALDVCPECGGPMQQRGPLRPEPPPRPAFW